MAIPIFDNIPMRRGTNSVKWDLHSQDESLPLWIADMDFPAAKEIQDSLRKALELPIYGYELAPVSIKSTIAEWILKTHSWEVNPEWIEFIPSARSALFLGCLLADPTYRRAIVSPPIYPPFMTIPTYAGLEVSQVPLLLKESLWSFDIAGIQDCADLGASTYLLCNPHNPVGRCYTREELESLASACLSHNLLILSDEVHCDLVLNPDSRHIPIASIDSEIGLKSITIMGPGKTFNLAGLQTAFAIIPDRKLRKRFFKATHSFIPEISRFGFQSMMAAFSSSRDWKKSLIEYLRANRKLVHTMLGHYDCFHVTPSEATYLSWIKCDFDKDPSSPRPYELFYKAGIILSDGRTFGPSSEQVHSSPPRHNYLTENYVRLNFATSQQVLTQALERMICSSLD